MAEPIKFTEEELNKIKEIQQEYQNKTLQFGQLELEKIAMFKKQDELFKYEDALKSDYASLQQKEKELVEELSKKYGPGTLNPQTGEFTPAETPAVPTS